MVDSHLVKNRRLKIMDMNGLVGNVDAVVIGLAVGHSPTDSGTGQPVGKTIRMMVPSIILLGELALAIDRTAEFSTPDNKGVLEHPPLLQIEQQGRGRLVGVLALCPHLLRGIPMRVPAAMVELNKPNAPFRQATRQQAVISVPPNLRRIRAI